MGHRAQPTYIDEVQKEFTECRYKYTELKNDGLYRHYRFVDEEDPIHLWFEIVTWPGFLTITGDVGTFVFSRTNDMFNFFSSAENVKPNYWAEKCQAYDSAVEMVEFDPSMAYKYICDEIDEQIKYETDEGKIDQLTELKESWFEDAQTEGEFFSTFNENEDILDIEAADGFPVYRYTRQYLYCIIAIHYATNIITKT